MKVRLGQKGAVHKPRDAILAHIFKFSMINVKIERLLSMTASTLVKFVFLPDICNVVLWEKEIIILQFDPVLFWLPADNQVPVLP